jgi:hypothetical protein
LFGDGEELAPGAHQLIDKRLSEGRIFGDHRLVLGPVFYFH